MRKMLLAIGVSALTIIVWALVAAEGGIAVDTRRTNEAMIPAATGDR